jgi:hypothetical protein
MDDRSSDLERRLARVVRRLADDVPYSPAWAADMAEFEEVADALGLRGVRPDAVRESAAQAVHARAS